MARSSGSGARWVWAGITALTHSTSLQLRVLIRTLGADNGGFLAGWEPGLNEVPQAQFLAHGKPSASTTFSVFIFLLSIQLNDWMGDHSPWRNGLM